MKKLIILDAGHGGLIGKYMTAGKRSPQREDGKEFYEGVFNRMIVNNIQFRLMGLGIPCTILAPENNDLQLPARVQRAKRLHSKYNCFGVSVHSNAAGDPNVFEPDATGWEVWTSEGETDSDRYAEHFMREIEARFPSKKMRKGLSGKVSKEKNLYILSRTPMPFVLTENFFMTSQDEVDNILTNQEGINKIVEAHVEAIKCVYEEM